MKKSMKLMVTLVMEASAGNRPQDWTFVEGGYTITHDDAVSAE